MKTILKPQAALRSAPSICKQEYLGKESITSQRVAFTLNTQALTDVANKRIQVS